MGPRPDLIVFGWEVHLYSIFFALGALVSYLIARKFSVKIGVEVKKFDNTVLIVFVLGLVGARLFFVLGHWTNYFRYNLSEILQFWRGGLGFYGGVIGGLVGSFLSSQIFKIKFLSLLDSLALGLPLAQGLGRLGNYFNQEAFGSPTELPWGIFIDQDRRPPGLKDYSYYHPTFLYELIGLLFIFLLLLWLKKGQVKTGVLFGVYAILSGTLRALIEVIRLDALIVFNLKISQLAAIVLAVVGLALIARRNTLVNS